MRGFAATGIALVRTRLELLRLEAREEVTRLTSLLIWGITAVLLAVVGIVFLGIFFTVLLWDSHRLLALGIFAALFLAAAVGAVAMTLRLIWQGSRLFSASIAELHHDEAALKAQDSRS